MYPATNMDAALVAGLNSGTALTLPESLGSLRMGGPATPPASSAHPPTA